MNTLVAIGQIFMSNEQIQEMIKEAEKCKALSEDFCMRNSPLFMVALYFLLGCIFTRFAITNVTDTIWNMWTILFAVMATIDFNLALRLILIKFTKVTTQPPFGVFLILLVSYASHL